MAKEAAKTATTAATARDESCRFGTGVCNASCAPARDATVTPRAATQREKASNSAARKPTMPKAAKPTRRLIRPLSEAALSRSRPKAKADTTTVPRISRAKEPRMIPGEDAPVPLL
jgi:hypothetical protein